MDQKKSNYTNVTIRKSTGEGYTISLPNTLMQLPIDQKICFDVCKEDIALWMSKQTEDDLIADNTYYLYLLARAVSEFVGENIITFLEFDVTDLVDNEGNILPHILVEHFNAIKENTTTTLDPNTYKSSEKTLTWLFEYANQLINSYEFEFKDTTKYMFKHGGINYEIPHIVVELFSGKKQFSNFSVRQSQQVMNIKKYLKNYKSIDVDTTMHDRYNKSLEWISSVVKQEGQDIPMTELGFTQYVETNMRLFSDPPLPTQIALDILFFFDRYYTHLKKFGDAFYFFNPVGELSEEEKTRQSKVFNRILFSGLAVTIMEMGLFTVAHEAPIISANKADFAEAIRFISLKNAGA